MAAIDDISNLYVGYFNRAADPLGLNFWLAQYTALGTTPAALAGIANSFAQVPEATNLYSFLAAPLVGSSTSFLNSVYLNLFNRVIDAPGSAFWAGQLALPGAAVGRVIQNIISGAQGDDALVVANKSLVSKTFAQNILDNNAVFNSALAANALTGVTKDAATATAKIASNLIAIQGSAGSVGGLTFTLTASPDTLTGGASNDTFNGLVDSDAGSGQTFTSADILNAGGGTGDIFNILFDTAAATAFPNATVNDFEIFNFRNVSGNTLAFDSSLIAGDTNVNADRSTSQIDITKLATGAAVGIIGNGVVANGAVNIGYNTATDAGIINVSGGTTGGAIAYTSTPSSVIMNSTLAANTVGTLNVGGAASGLTINATTNLTTGVLTGAALKTITATGGATTVSIGGATNGTAVLPVGITSINGSGLTAGGIATTLGANTTAFIGGLGNDTVSIANTGTTSLVFNGSTKLDAGAGTGDIFALNDQAGLTAATAPNILGFEVVQIMDDTAAGDTFTLSLLGAGLTGLRLSANANADTVSGISSTVAGNVTILGNLAGAPTLNVTGATTVGQIDTLGFVIADTDPSAAVSTATIADIIAAGVENVNFAATGNLILTVATGLTALTSSTITGSGTVNITTNALALNVNTSINAAANTGGLTFDATLATGNGIAITGSATKANTITGTNLAAKSDSLTGGAANDTILGLDGADTINAGDGNDSVTGGVGADIINVGGGTDTVLLTAAGQTASFATTAALNTAITSGTATAQAYDVVSGAAAADILSVAGVINTITGALGTTTAAATGNTASLVAGTFAGGVFTAGAGSDKLFVYDVDGAGGAGTVVEAVVLVGLASTTGTAAAGVVTFA